MGISHADSYEESSLVAVTREKDRELSAVATARGFVLISPIDNNGRWMIDKG